MTAPLVSVVMPCWRASATVGAAVASVLAQTERDLELILVEDGCPEGSAAVAEIAAAGDPRLIVLRQPNGGIARARNAGIALARGTLVAFLDSDDAWEPEALALHAAAFAADPGLGIGFGRVRFYDPTLRVPGRISAAHGPLDLAAVLGEFPPCTGSNLVLRRVVLEQAGGFDPALRHAEDQELVARILATTAWRAAGLDAELVRYRTSPGGLSSDLAAMEGGWLAMLARLAAVAPGPVAAARPHAEAMFRRYLARRALRTGQPGALRQLVRAAAASPLALLRHAPHRTAMTLGGALAGAALPSHLLSR